VGAYSAALEYGASTEALVVGKPAAAFFEAALTDLGASAENALMVGDDVEADVGGALACNLEGILVRTGKYREELLQSSGVQPTQVVDSIADVPALYAPARLEQRKLLAGGRLRTLPLRARAVQDHPPLRGRTAC
jgi:ribonucleotide monophosphatase NagD (HAD superfamily)